MKTKSKNEHPTSTLRKRYDERMATSYGAQDEQGDKRTRNY